MCLECRISLALIGFVKYKRNVYCSHHIQVCLIVYNLAEMREGGALRVGISGYHRFCVQLSYLHKYLGNRELFIRPV